MIALDSVPQINRIALIGQKLHLNLTETSNRFWLEYCSNFKVGNEYNPYGIHRQSIILHKWLLEHGTLESYNIEHTNMYRGIYRYTPEKFKSVLNSKVQIILARNSVTHLWCDLFICVNYPILRMEQNSGQETLT